MSFKLHEIRDNIGALRKPKLLGRGIGSGLGKTSGRGGKGQTARSGVSLNGFEGGQMPIYRRLPKRGFKSRHYGFYFELHFDKLKALFAAGKVTKDTIINRSFLIEQGIMPKSFQGISLIAKGDPFDQPLKFCVTRASKQAKELVESKGGVVMLEDGAAQ